MADPYFRKFVKVSGGNAFLLEINIRTEIVYLMGNAILLNNAEIQMKKWLSRGRATIEEVFGPRDGERIYDIYQDITSAAKQADFAKILMKLSNEGRINPAVLDMDEEFEEFMNLGDDQIAEQIETYMGTLRGNEETLD